LKFIALFGTVQIVCEGTAHRVFEQGRGRHFFPGIVLVLVEVVKGLNVGAAQLVLARLGVFGLHHQVSLGGVAASDGRGGLVHGGTWVGEGCFFH